MSAILLAATNVFGGLFPGGHLYTTTGSHTFTVPAGVTSISAVSVAGGGGGGGSLTSGSLSRGGTYLMSYSGSGTQGNPWTATSQNHTASSTGHITWGVGGGGTVYWKIRSSSEQNFDFARLYVAGSLVASVSGSAGVQTGSNSVSAGNTVQFRYSKDGSVSSFADTGYLDYLYIIGSSFTGNAGGGGGLAWKNNIPVTAGESLTVFVGAGGSGGSNPGNGSDSYVRRGATDLVRASGGNFTNGTGGSMTVGDGGGSGGSGGSDNGGGGGAGGYSGSGGAGSPGAGGGGGGGSGGAGAGGNLGGSSGPPASAGGGGVGLFGQGSNGTAGSQTTVNGSTGSTSVNPSSTTAGRHGGGGGAASNGSGHNGGDGGVRIIWGPSNLTRSFPSTNVDVSTTYTNGESESLN